MWNLNNETNENEDMILFNNIYIYIFYTYW